ncbi:hypothetical protein V5F53_15020 [Xanthobacter sp. V4C-4]|uniref:hypothetical protein n=1 Tax=Xanthobacter cornucopiae TaxID=3119924 RepID=UPI003726A4CD
MLASAPMLVLAALDALRPVVPDTMQLMAFLSAVLVLLGGGLTLLFWWVQPFRPGDNAHSPAPDPPLPAGA